MNSYKTLAGRATASIIEKKSEFIATAAPVQTEQAALALLQQVRAAHRTANHNVYAYQLREGARQRYSDDGEPAKTAGLPVLSVITHAALTDCIVVVTRYFGGTLLGTGGLVRAYTAAAKAGLQAAGTAVVTLCVTLTLTLEYSLYEPARRLLEQAGAHLAEPQFTGQVRLAATLPQADVPAALPALTELLRGAENIHTGQPFWAPF